MAGTCVNMRWWPERWSGVNLTNRTGSGGPVMTSQQCLQKGYTGSSAAQFEIEYISGYYKKNKEEDNPARW